MNTRELDDLTGWDEDHLTLVVAEFVRCYGRLPHLEELAALSS